MFSKGLVEYMSILKHFNAAYKKRNRNYAHTQLTDLYQQCFL